MISRIDKDDYEDFLERAPYPILPECDIDDVQLGTYYLPLDYGATNIRDAVLAMSQHPGVLGYVVDVEDSPYAEGKMYGRKPVYGYDYSRPWPRHGVHGANSWPVISEDEI